MVGLPWRPRVRRLRAEDASTRPDARPLTPERLEGSLRIGYVVWDWPALSQTFVLSEIRELQSRGHDVVVYFKVWADQQADLDFDVEAHQVDDADHLRRLLVDHGRQVMHSPFAYPSTTLLVWPASQATGIPFTFMAGGVDVAHYDNIKRNRVGEVASDPGCLGVVTLGTFHRDLLLECGVPSQRIVMERQSAALPAFASSVGGGDRPVLVSIGRFIEKKGLEFLVRAAARMPDVDVRLFGYGPLEESLRALVVETGATNVEFAGSLQGKGALEAAYHSSDLFVLPCVRAENGDLDGLPTVLLEAMAAGVPVVTTDAANIPDLVVDGFTGFLCEQRDVDSLVAAVRRALSSSPSRRAALARAARRQAEAYASPSRTTDTLLRLWRRDSLDIVLVTYDRDGHRSEEDTVAVIERLLRLTTLPFSLTIVDNDSDARFVRRLATLYGDHPQVDIVPLRDNIFCGPASNIGFGRGRAPYLVYVCSNEGFLLRHGWDHLMVRTLERTGAAMAGFPVELAKFRTGAELTDYPSFADWRSTQFALDNPDRRFRHVQGGLFVVRREAFEAAEGFNPAVPQAGMDVEFSHRLESLGHTLAAVPGVVAITVKTRPTLLSMVDEFTVAVHPSRADTVGLLDSVVSRTSRLCPVCEWHGPTFDGDACPGCGSNPFSRTAMRLLSQSGQLQTRPRARVVAREASLRTGLGRLCPDLVVEVTDDPVQALSVVTAMRDDVPGLVVVDRYWDGRDQFAEVLPDLLTLVDSGALVLAAAHLEADQLDVDALLADRTLADRSPAEVLDLVSGVCSFDPYPVVQIGFPYRDGALQGIEC